MGGNSKFPVWVMSRVIGAGTRESQVRETFSWWRLDEGCWSGEVVYKNVWRSRGWLEIS